jgi:leader peptidase (prepilin peptidase)/N-methyltransferase
MAGLGDIKLIAAAGIWLPVLGSFYAIALASIVALAGALALALWRGRTATLLDSLPFAVFLAPAFWLLWLLEEAGVLPALS